MSHDVTKQSERRLDREIQCLLNPESPSYLPRCERDVRVREVHTILMRERWIRELPGMTRRVYRKRLTMTTDDLAHLPDMAEPVARLRELTASL